MPDAYRISAPGRENGLKLGLRVPEGDTVVIGNITYDRSETTFSVLNLAVNTTAFTIDGVTYGAGRGLTFDLQVSTAISSRTAHVDFAYTTEAGIQRTDRLHLLIYDAVAVEASSEIGGASVLGQTGLADNLLAVMGTTSVDQDLGEFTGTIIPDDSTVKEALQALETTAESTADSVAANAVYNVVDYGANPNATGDGTRDSYAAIQAALTDIRAAIRSQNYGTGSSIVRQFVPVLYFPPGGKYEISAPIDLYHYNIHIRGYNAQVMATTDFNTNYPDGWAFRSGDYSSGYVHANTGNVFVDIRGLTFHGFKRCLRLGLPGNNINQAAMLIQDCHFLGVSSSVYCDVAIRVANRSTVATISHCHFDKCDVCVDVQSADRVRVQDCRCQAGSFPAYDTRDLRHGYFRVYRGQLHLDKLLCNPINSSLISQFAAYARNTAYTTGDVVQATTPTVNVPQLYVALTDHTSDNTESYTAAQSFAVDLAANRWELTDQKPVGWALASDIPRFVASKYYVRGDIIREPYTSGANEVLWARKTSGTAGATFDATEQAQWYVWAAAVTGTGAFVGGTSYQTGDIVRALVSGGSYPTGYRFYRSNSTRVATSEWDDTERANWTVVTNSDANNYAGDDASVWRCIYVNQCFFGGEGGGISPVIWDTAHDDEDNYPTYVGYASDCVVKDCTIGTNVRHASKSEGIANGLFAPAVLLVQAPNRLIVDDNLFSLTYSVAAQWSADSNYTPWAIGVDAPRYVRAEGNVGSNTRALNGYTENFVPPDLLSETVTTAAPALKTDGVSRIDSASNAVAATLANGSQVGDTKIIVMIDATNSSTVSVAQHETSDPEVFTFDAIGEFLELRWEGSQWVTIKATATT